MQVFATDLWISPSENYARIRQFGLEDRVNLFTPKRTRCLMRTATSTRRSHDAYHLFRARTGFSTHLVPWVRKAAQLRLPSPVYSGI